MPLTIRSPDASWPTTTPSSDAVRAPLYRSGGAGSLSPGTSTSGSNVVLLAPGSPEPKSALAEGCIDIDDYVAELEKDPALVEPLREASKWVADTVYPDELSVRVLRLRIGLSQTQLARQIGTSQPHLARIEAGASNLQLETCRRLCAALGVDLNTLDQALQPERKPAP